MKRPLGLIILFILTSANAVFHLIQQSKEFAHIEEHVSGALKSLYKRLPDDFDLDSIPEWLAKGILGSVKHYQDFGVTMFHMKSGVYMLTLMAVILMFLWKKSGFSIYIVAQVLNICAIGYGYGFNPVAISGILLVALISGLFIWLYHKLFIKKLALNSAPV